MSTKLDFTTKVGFYYTYFDLLKVHSSKTEAFNFLNNQVEKITGKKLYTDYSSFVKGTLK
jgi:hypothetical protein